MAEISSVIATYVKVKLKPNCLSQQSQSPGGMRLIWAKISDDLLDLRGFLDQFSLIVAKMVEQDKGTDARDKSICLIHAFPFFFV